MRALADVPACDSSELLFLSGRIAVAFVLAAVAVVAIVLGFKLYSRQRGRRDGTLVKWGKLEIRVGAVGAAMMILAFAVAYWAYRVTPREYKKSAEATTLSIAPEIPERARFFVPAGPNKTLSCERTQVELRCKNLVAGEACGAAPAFVEGVGRMQVARVARRSGEARDEVARNLERTLRKFLFDRDARETWAPRLMAYSSPTDEGTIVRIVFNNVGPEAVTPMCQWLRCEGWAYGPCELVSPDSK